VLYVQECSGVLNESNKIWVVDESFYFENITGKHVRP
jgi:hypothetical protein